MLQIPYSFYSHKVCLLVSVMYLWSLIQFTMMSDFLLSENDLCAITSLLALIFDLPIIFSLILIKNMTFILFKRGNEILSEYIEIYPNEHKLNTLLIYYEWVISRSNYVRKHIILYYYLSCRKDISIHRFKNIVGSITRKSVHYIERTIFITPSLFKSEYLVTIKSRTNTNILDRIEHIRRRFLPLYVSHVYRLFKYFYFTSLLGSTLLVLLNY